MDGRPDQRDGSRTEASPGRGSAPGHVPVLLEESRGFLGLDRGGLFVDCTLGLGGHSEAFLAHGPGVRVLGLDRDHEALERARQRLAPYGDRFEAVHSNYADLADALAGRGPIAGIFADLGVSSMQLDRAERGFSFQRTGPLDMRMDARGDGPTAADVVMSYSQSDLERVIRDYGEERQARRIARSIVRRREESPLRTTEDLRSAVHDVVRSPRRHGGRPRIDPATRTFQALRIEVNQELAGLETMLDQAMNALETEGRLVVISYHSLEDRITKSALRAAARGEVDEVTGSARVETRLIELLTKKPVRPTEKEVETNPRSRSARLRAARRI